MPRIDNTKTPMTSHVDNDVAEWVIGKAAETKLTKSETINALLREAMLHSKGSQWWDIAGLNIRRVIKEQFQKFFTMLGRRFTRHVDVAIVEATAARKLVELELESRAIGLSEQDRAAHIAYVQQMSQLAQQRAVDEFKQRYGIEPERIREYKVDL